MIVAHLMEEVESELYGATEVHLRVLRTALSQVYRPRSCGIEYCPPDVVQFYKTQANMRYPFRAAYMDRFMVRIRAAREDLIVMTEPWHVECFKGLLQNGVWRETRVVSIIRYEQEHASVTKARVSLALMEFTRCQNRSALRTHSPLEIISP